MPNPIGKWQHPHDFYHVVIVCRPMLHSIPFRGCNEGVPSHFEPNYNVINRILRVLPLPTLIVVDFVSPHSTSFPNWPTTQGHASQLTDPHKYLCFRWHLQLPQVSPKITVIDTKSKRIQRFKQPIHSIHSHKSVTGIALRHHTRLQPSVSKQQQKLLSTEQTRNKNITTKDKQDRFNRLPYEGTQTNSQQGET